MTKIKEWSREIRKAEVGWFAAAYIMLLAYTVLALSLPVRISALLSFAGDSPAVFRRDLLICIGILFSGSVLLFLVGYVRQTGSKRFALELKTKIWANNLRAPFSAHRKRDAEEDLQLVLLRTDQIGTYYYMTIPAIVQSILLLAGSVSACCILLRNAGVFFVVIPVVFALMNALLILKQLAAYQEGFVAAHTGYVSLLVRLMDEVRCLKLFVLYDKMKQKIDGSVQSIARFLYPITRLSMAQTAVTRLLYTIMVVYAVFRYVTGTLTLAQFLVFEQYAVIIGTQALVLAEKLRERTELRVVESALADAVLDAEEEAVDTVAGIQSISFENVSFSFEEQTPLLQGIHHTFETGKCYVLQAPNGFGKSTLFDLLTGIEQPDQGRILYNASDAAGLNMERIRRNLVCYQTQAEYFPAHDIKGNISCYLDAADEQNVFSELERFGMSGTEKEGNLNETLSGGQKKKLLLSFILSKAVCCDHPLILLDEPLNTLDKAAAASLKERVKELKKDAIVLIISHDDSFHLVADEVIRFDKEIAS